MRTGPFPAVGGAALLTVLPTAAAPVPGPDPAGELHSPLGPPGSP